MNLQQKMHLENILSSTPDFHVDDRIVTCSTQNDYCMLRMPNIYPLLPPMKQVQYSQEIHSEIMRTLSPNLTARTDHMNRITPTTQQKKWPQPGGQTWSRPLTTGVTHALGGDEGNNLSFFYGDDLWKPSLSFQLLSDWCPFWIFLDGQTQKAQRETCRAFAGPMAFLECECFGASLLLCFSVLESVCCLCLH